MDDAQFHALNCSACQKGRVCRTAREIADRKN